MTTTRRVTTALAGAALLLGPTSLASHAAADHGHGNPSAGCGQQEKQVAKAEDALERLTALFQAKQSKVKKAKDELRNADRGSERAQERRELARAKAGRDEAAKDKKAQEQRLAHAQERLADCQSEHAADAED